MAIRTVRIYRVVVIDDHDVEANPPKKFWVNLFQKHPAVSPLAYGIHEITTTSATLLEGQLRVDNLGAPHFIYIGRSRDRVDWPDRRTTSQPELTPLADDVDTTAVFEPLRLKPISNSPYVAIVRSYAGALPSAVEEWLTEAYSSVVSNRRVELRPVTRQDQLDRLDEAVGVSRLSISLEGHADSSGGTIEQSVDDLQREVGFPVRTEITLSMGNNKDFSAYDALRGLLRKVLSATGTTRAEATLLTTEDDGTLTREVVDFFSDKVAYPIDVHSDDVSDEEYIRVLDEAIQKFRVDQANGVQ